MRMRMRAPGEERRKRFYFTQCDQLVALIQSSKRKERTNTILLPPFKYSLLL